MKVKVRIAVAVDADGKWAASGWGTQAYSTTRDLPMEIAIEGVEAGENRYWVEAELEIPETKTIQGEVQEA
jgi:hypothetical protein